MNWSIKIKLTSKPKLTTYSIVGTISLKLMKFWEKLKIMGCLNLDSSMGSQFNISCSLPPPRIRISTWHCFIL